MESIQTLSVYSERDNQVSKISGYYRLHAKIYDLTRWTFLFGRRSVLDWLPYVFKDRPSIVEVGCGTGHNLKNLSQRFPKARLTGLDISSEMLDIADRKLKEVPNLVILRQKIYGSETVNYDKPPDCVLFSYCLTMVNPDWEKLILQAKEDLQPDGVIAVVDFHTTPQKWFQRWMGINHVRIDAHILPFLNTHFASIRLEKRRAYFGLWHYFIFIGKIK